MKYDVPSLSARFIEVFALLITDDSSNERLIYLADGVAGRRNCCPIYVRLYLSRFEIDALAS